VPAYPSFCHEPLTLGPVGAPDGLTAEPGGSAPPKLATPTAHSRGIEG
jgi:hypothetical protein